MPVVGPPTSCSNTAAPPSMIGGVHASVTFRARMRVMEAVWRGESIHWSVPGTYIVDCDWSNLVACRSDQDAAQRRYAATYVRSWLAKPRRMQHRPTTRDAESGYSALNDCDWPNLAACRADQDATQRRCTKHECDWTNHDACCTDQHMTRVDIPLCIYDCDCPNLVACLGDQHVTQSRHTSACCITSSHVVLSNTEALQRHYTTSWFQQDASDFNFGPSMTKLDFWTLNTSSSRHPQREHIGEYFGKIRAVFREIWAFLFFEDVVYLSRRRNKKCWNFRIFDVNQGVSVAFLVTIRR